MFASYFGLICNKKTSKETDCKAASGPIVFQGNRFYSEKPKQVTVFCLLISVLRGVITFNILPEVLSVIKM